MMRWFRLPSLLVVVAALLGGGCGWLDRPASDPKREANFVDGQNWKDQRRWDQARDSFYRALEVNPGNYYAHQELGFLFHEQFHEHGTALYHFRRYLDLAARDQKTEIRDPIVEGRIRNAEIELARKYAGEIGRQQSQVEVDQLRRANADLQQRVEMLTRQLALVTQSPGTATTTNPPPVTPNPPPQTTLQPAVRPTATNNPATRRPPPTSPTVTTPPTGPATPTGAPAMRTHKIRAGDTPANLARQYGVRLADLMAANPGLDARRLRQGQVINIPAK